MAGQLDIRAVVAGQARRIACCTRRCRGTSSTGRIIACRRGTTPSAMRAVVPFAPKSPYDLASGVGGFEHTTLLDIGWVGEMRHELARAFEAVDEFVVHRVQTGRRSSCRASSTRSGTRRSPNAHRMASETRQLAVRLRMHGVDWTLLIVSRERMGACDAMRRLDRVSKSPPPALGVACRVVRPGGRRSRCVTAAGHPLGA